MSKLEMWANAQRDGEEKKKKKIERNYRAKI